jgi:putative peptidoglycan lipid II flippase
MKLRLESYREGIAYSTIFNVVSKGLTFGLNILIAASFGVNAKTDLYFFLLGTSFSVVQLITSVNAAVLIPEFVRLGIHGETNVRRRFASSALTVYGLVALVMAFLILFLPEIVLTASSRFPQALIVENQNLIRCFGLILPLMVITTFLLDIATSIRMFTAPMIGSVMNSVLAALAVLISGSFWGIGSVAAGLAAGYAIQCCLLIWLLRNELSWRRVFSFPRIPVDVLKNVGFAQIGNVASFAASYIPLYLLTGFRGGVVGAMYLAQRLADVPSQLITVQVTSVIAIRMNESYARKEFSRLYDSFVRTARFLILILVPLSIFMLVEGEESIRLVFARGAFDKEAVESTYNFFRFLCFLPPLIAVNMLCARLFMASQLVREPLPFQIGMSFLALSLIYVLVVVFGPSGIALGTLLGYAINISMVGWLIRRYHPDLNYYGVFRFLAGAAGFFGLVGILLMIGGWLIGSRDGMSKMFLSGAIIISSLIAYARFADTDGDLVHLLQRIWGGGSNQGA